MKFKCLKGGYQDNKGKNYDAGDVVTTHSDLASNFPGLFEKLEDNSPKRTEITDLAIASEKGCRVFKEGAFYKVYDTETGEEISQGEEIKSKKALQEFFEELG
jgi:hypothetical protein